MSSSTTPSRAVAVSIDAAQVAHDPLQGLDVVDLGGSRRVPVLLEMVAALSRAAGAKEVLRQFAAGFYKLWGPRGYVSLSTRGLRRGEYKITRLVTTDDLADFAEADPWARWGDLPVHRGGILGRIVRHGGPVILQNLDLRDDPVVGSALERYCSLMAIPLYDGGEPLNWAITLREDPASFSVAELEESILRSNLGGWAVKNAIITQALRAAHEEIRRELQQIARIQRALLPDMPDIPGLEIGVSYETFDQAGGDMYVLRPLRPLRHPVPRGTEDPPAEVAGQSCCDPCGPWGILVGDVSGHGPAAAVVMAMMRAIIDAYPHEPRGPAEVLEHANLHLCAKRIQERFVTAFMAVYDPGSRRLSYARAGHTPPVWMRPQRPGGPRTVGGHGGPAQGGWDMARLDEVGGIPLGIDGSVRYEEAAITLDPGHSVVLCTDGVTEAMSPQGVMYGVRGIEASLTECTGAPACVIDHIRSALRGHESGVRPTDDQTIVVLRVKDPQAAGD